MNIVAVEPIGITTEQADEISSLFAKEGHQFLLFPDRKEDEPTLIERMRDADVVIVSNIKITQSVLSQCSHLKMIAVAFTGIDHIDTVYCASREIEVRNAAGYATEAVAELSVGLMLALYRRIPFLDNDTRNGLTRRNFLGQQLSDKTVGIVGTGAIGTATAKLLQAFSCKIMAFNRTRHREIENMSINYYDIDTLLKTADIISVHLPLTTDTFHFLSAERLQLCKKEAVIINTARGNVIDNTALAAMLKANRLAGAGIDVFETEPPLPADHPLLGAPNCIVVPHVGYATREAFDIRINIVINNILSWLSK